MTEAGTASASEHTLDSGVFYRRWETDRPRAVALIVHGLGEHSGRYRHVAEALAERGVSTWAVDHLGHGRSPGHRCHIDRFAQFFEPLDALRELIAAQHPGLPCFIIGHSMGGLITAAYLASDAARQERYAGAVFSGAALEVPDTPSAMALFFNRLIAALLPRLGVLQLDPSEVSRDPEVVRRYREDPLVHSGKITARLAVELFTAMSEVAAGRGAIGLPLLIMHGEGDVMTAASGSRNFFDAVASDDKTLRLYPGLYHEIFNEPEQDQVLGELCDWLEAHLSQGGAVGAGPDTADAVSGTDTGS